MKRINLLGILLVGLTVSGCGCYTQPLQVRIDKGANPWTHLRMNNDPAHFQFAIVSDRTGGRRPGVFADALRKINLLQPEFVICIGDLIDGKTEDETQLKQEWDDLDRIVGQLEMPFFYVPGNHDLSNAVMLETWKQRYGRPYYYFLYHDVLFLCLNSESGEYEKSGRLSKAQLAYFQQVLHRYPKVRWTLVFLHKPLWQTNGKNWAEFETLLGKRPYTVFAGHKHTYAKQVRNGRNYIRLATTGGGNKVWGVEANRANAIRLGKFDHVVWVTMTENGPRLANLTLDGIWDENVTPFFISLAAEFMKFQLDQGRIVQCPPVRVAQEPFQQAKASILYTNFAALPMNIKLAVQSQSNLKVIPSESEIEILPFSTKTVTLTIKADPPLSAPDLKPLAVQSEISYKFPLKKPFQCTLTKPITFLQEGKNIR